jgi:toxin ParE1/3/4
VKLVWLRRALSDRDAQLDYIARDSIHAAIEQGDRIVHQLDLLIEHPEMGRAGRMQGTRELVISGTPFIAVYRLKPRAKRLELLRILHGAQRWPQSRK